MQRRAEVCRQDYAYMSCLRLELCRLRVDAAGRSAAAAAAPASVKRSHCLISQLFRETVCVALGVRLLYFYALFLHWGPA